MSGSSTILLTTPYAVVRESAFDVAVLPWGATEAHNYHLPYGTDVLESDQIAAGAARAAASRGARVVVLPTVPFGVNTGQLDIPLTINMNPSTQMAVLRDVLRSLERHHIPRLMILNSHGGNDFRQMIRELQPDTPLFLCVVNWYKVLNHRDFFDAPGDHADEMETSLMLHLAPQHVLPLDRAGSGKENPMRIGGFREGWAWTPRQWTKATNDTGVGDPRAATAEKGKRFFMAVTEKVGGFIAELAQADPEQLYEKPVE